jgi:hypothetical protein
MENQEMQDMKKPKPTRPRPRRALRLCVAASACLSFCCAAEEAAFTATGDAPSLSVAIKVAK